MDDLIQIAYDFFNAMRYIFSNIGTLISVLFLPLNWLFAFLKGFFVGVSTPPPTTAIAWTFPSNVMSLINTIPYMPLLEQILGVALAITVLSFIFRKIIHF